MKESTAEEIAKRMQEARGAMSKLSKVFLDFGEAAHQAQHSVAELSAAIQQFTLGAATLLVNLEDNLKPLYPEEELGDLHLPVLSAEINLDVPLPPEQDAKIPMDIETPGKVPLFASGNLFQKQPHKVPSFGQYMPISAKFTIPLQNEPAQIVDYQDEGVLTFEGDEELKAQYKKAVTKYKEAMAKGGGHIVASSSDEEGNPKKFFPKKSPGEEFIKIEPLVQMPVDVELHLKQAAAALALQEIQHQHASVSLQKLYGDYGADLSGVFPNVNIAEDEIGLIPAGINPIIELPDVDMNGLDVGAYTKSIWDEEAKPLTAQDIADTIGELGLQKLGIQQKAASAPVCSAEHITQIVCGVGASWCQVIDDRIPGKVEVKYVDGPEEDKLPKMIANFLPVGVEFIFKKLGTSLTPTGQVGIEL